MLSNELSEGEQKLVNPEKDKEGEEGVGGSRGVDKGETFHMASRSPARSTFVESDLTEFDGGLPKSPMRDRFLNDLGSTPTVRSRSRDVSMSPIRERGTGYSRVSKSPSRQRHFSKSPVRESETSFRPGIGDSVDVELPTGENLTEFDEGFSKFPMRERFLNDLGSDSPMRLADANRSPMRDRVQGDFDSDGTSKSPARQRNASQLPIRESKTQMSVRSRNVSRSPMTEGRDATGSPARSMAGNFPKSPMRIGFVSEFDKFSEAEQEDIGAVNSDVLEEAEDRKLTPKSSFNVWLNDSDHTGQSNDTCSGKRRTWRDQVGSGVDPRNKSSYQDSESEGSSGYMTSRAVVEHGRMPTSSSNNLGRASNYRPNSINNYSEPRNNVESLRGPGSVWDLEMERAELLQRYKELSEQLGNLDDRRISSTGFYEPCDHSEDELGRFKARSGKKFVPDRGARRPVYVHHSHSPVSNMADVYGIHPHLHDHPSSSQLTRDARARKAYGFLKPDSVGGRYDQDSLESYVNETHYHHPSCSCSVCYTDDCHRQDLPYSGRRSDNFLGSSRSSHSMNLGRYDQRIGNPRIPNTSPLERSSHLAYLHPRRHQLVNLKKQSFLPIGGGAPFVLCSNCFRFLKLPLKFMHKRKNEHKVQCGDCSSVMSFYFLGKSLNLLTAQNGDCNGADSGLVNSLKGLSLHDRYSCDATSTNVESDFDAVGTSFQSMDSEPSEKSKTYRLSANLADNKRQFSPSSSHSSKEDQISDNPSLRSSRPNSTEIPLKMNLIPPPPGSPLRDLLDYSSYFRKVQAGEVMSYTGEDREETEKEASVENSLEKTTMAVEMDVHSQEIPPNSFSQDSEGTPGQEHKDGKNEAIQSSVIESISPESTEVHVNGQQIPQYLVKKAEKFAGPIEPGEYWYDSKAGFWGVMGHRCLGIIPPYIREFSFRLPENCSRGDTAVYVNGRELHKKDLDILESRRLPTTRNKRYIIDISGKVLDEETKKFVVSLGKLAPTVERKRRGFGMQVPEHLDDN